MRLIDADHLKRWILARWEEMDPRSANPLRAIDILDQVDREDTIDAEPVRHGHWIPFGSMHHCSICEETVLVPTTIADIPTYDYCPHCGAKMEVEAMYNEIG